MTLAQTLGMLRLLVRGRLISFKCPCRAILARRKIRLEGCSVIVFPYEKAEGYSTPFEREQNGSIQSSQTLHKEQSTFLHFRLI